MERLSLSESKRRWQVLLARQDAIKAILPTTARPGEFSESLAHANGDNDSREDDPFECQSMAIPPTQILVENVLEDFAHQWQQLDYRKIIAPERQQQNNNNSNDDDNESENNDNANADLPENNGTKGTKASLSSSKTKINPRWTANHFSLPAQFDYATRQSEPPPADNPDGDRVVSLTDPTKSLSYERALWELFQQVPTVQEIEDQILQGSSTSLPHTSHMYHHEMVEGFQRNFRMDAHSLSRLRTSDRHEMPPILHNTTKITNTSPIGKSSSLGKSPNARTSTNIGISTIRFECWRRQPKRGQQPDPDRAVLEFKGSQTLEDLHCALVELAEDELWNIKLQSPSPSSQQSASTSTSREHRQQREQGEDLKQDDENIDTVDSGYFFIENTFYTIGSVDYVTPIQQWLDMGIDPQQKSSPRKTFLGITSTSTPLPVVLMSETRLEDIPFRLAVRYQHRCHGDVECALFVTDFNHITQTTTSKPQNGTNEQPSENNAVNIAYPLLHDVWTASFPKLDCEACQRVPASIATSPHCSITQGHRALCIRCCQQLFPGGSATTSTNSLPDAASPTTTATKGQAPRSSRRRGGPARPSPRKRKRNGTGTSADTNNENNETSKDHQEDSGAILLQPYSIWRNQPSLSASAFKESRLF